MMVRELKVRTAIKSDLPSIAELHYGLLQEDGKRRDPLMNAEWPREESLKFHQNFIGSQSAIALVAEIGSDVVGYLVGDRSGPSSLYPVIHTELISMFVRSEYRSIGVGSKLVAEFVAWSKEQNAEAMRVSAFAANEDAIRFYQRQGFLPKNVLLERKMS